MSIVVSTFGDDTWRDKAEERALPSARTFGVPVHYVHGTSLDDARNAGLDLVQTEFVCFLDADDELDPGYFDHMDRGTAEVRAPSVAYVHDGRRRRPHVPRVAGHAHDCTADCLAYGNWLVVGAVALTDVVREVGGWRDWPLYEDWDLWVRCWQAGATIEAVPEAVYVAHVRHDSRNRGPSRDVKHRTHQAIAQDLGLPVPT